MKITVYKNPEEYITRDYDLTNCSASEFEKALILHCEAAEVEPEKAAVVIPRGELSDHEYIIKGTSTTDMTMRDAAVDVYNLIAHNFNEAKRRGA